MFFVSCSKYDDSTLTNRINDLEGRVEKLEEQCRQMNTNISSLKSLVDAVTGNVYITDVTPIVENGVEKGYKITFSNTESVTIYHGQKGDDATAPVIGVRKDSDGRYYWTLDGEWLTGDDGEKICAEGSKGDDGDKGDDGNKGDDGITPQLKIDNDYWYVSYDNGQTWQQLGKATGGGDSLFKSVTQNNDSVTFTLSDNTVITVPKGAPLDITFSEADLVIMSPYSTRSIGYKVESEAESVTVEVISSSDIRARAVAADESGLSGYIEITVGSAIDEYSKVVVLVSDGSKVIMRSFAFEETGIQIYDSTLKSCDAAGGEVVLEFLSNMDCHVVIPEQAQSWISVAPDTRALEYNAITLKVEPNTEYVRSSEVYVITDDNYLGITFNIVQSGEKTSSIDPENIPDDEIWYTTIDGERILPYNTVFGSNLITSVYEDGIGRLVFDGPVSYIGTSAFLYCNTLTEMWLPDSVTGIGDSAFGLCTGLTSIDIPESVTSIGAFAFQSCAIDELTLPESLTALNLNIVAGCSNLKAFHGKFASEDNLCLISNESLYAFAIGAGLTEYTVPEGINMIESYAFYYARTLQNITLPSTLAVIDINAFQSCYNLEYIYGPYASADNKCAVIDGVLQLFAGKGVTEYTTPDNVTKVAGGVFSNMEDLSFLTISDEVREVGVNVMSAGYSMGFAEYCPNLRKVVMSARLTDMGSGFFTGCDALTEVYCRAPLPPKFDLYSTQYIPYPTIYVPDETISTYQNASSWSLLRDMMLPYDYGDLSEFYPEEYISTDYSQDGTFEVLQQAAEGSGINVVLMGDGYSDRQIADGTYRADMEFAYRSLFTEEPYKSFSHLFNVSYVNVVSAAEGYDYGNTAFECYFGDGTHVGGNDSKAFEYGLKALTEEQMDEAMIIIVMNSDVYAGTCYMYYPSNVPSDYGSGVSVSYFPKGSNKINFETVLHHEACGHGFSKLADEYAYEDYGQIPSSEVSATVSQQDEWGWWKNIDFTGDVSAVRWNYFISDPRYADEGLGAYEGGYTYWTGVWRPTYNSIMNDNTGGFNAPSREAIYYRIHRLAYGESWQYDYEDFVAYDAVNRKAAGMAKQEGPYRPMEPTHPPVVVRKTWRDAM